MWEDYGCFIINESKGSLKFYNGPGYSNKYAKPQFSSSVNTLIGVDFKQKTIPMKIGMYWFTIEEYQEFLNEIGPYVVNYLTFGYAKNYGYLVKLANIADSPRHVVGTNENGDCVYYTEMDLTWELLGDNCVRSNLPYEYKRKLDEKDANQYTWVFDDTHSDMKDSSLLDTPILFELPVSFDDATATLKLQAVNDNVSQPIDLFNISLRNLTYSQWLSPGYYVINNFFANQNYLWAEQAGLLYPTEYSFNLTDITVNSEVAVNKDNSKITFTFDSEFFGIYISGSANLLFSGDNQTINGVNYSLAKPEGKYVLTVTPASVTSVDFSIYKQYGTDSDIKNEVLTHCYKIPITYNNYTYDYVVAAKKVSEIDQDQKYLLIDSNSSFNGIDDTKFNPMSIGVDNKIVFDNYIDLTNSSLKKSWFTFQQYIESDDGDSEGEEKQDIIWDKFFNIYQMLLRYDSETGLIYIQEGKNDTWHLLNFQTDNNNGEYILASASITKWKIPGTFLHPSLNSTEWKFKISTTNIDLNIPPQQVSNTAITVYARKNIV